MPDAIAAHAPVAPVSHIREHNIGSALTAAGSITFGHPKTVLLPYLLITLPGAIIQMSGSLYGNTALTWIGILVGIATGLLAYGILVVTVSDISLGNHPSLRRSFDAITGRTLGALLLAGLAQTLLIGVGLVLFVIPGILAILWLLFTPAAVVIERKSATAALKRSRELARGYTRRHLGLVALFIGFSVACSVVFGVGLGLLGEFGTSQPLLGLLIYQLTAMVLQAVFVVTLVLFYYDLRVRNEAYSPDQLGEDLSR